MAQSVLHNLEEVLRLVVATFEKRVGAMDPHCSCEDCRMLRIAKALLPQESQNGKLLHHFDVHEMIMLRPRKRSRKIHVSKQEITTIPLSWNERHTPLCRFDTLGDEGWNMEYLNIKKLKDKEVCTHCRKVLQIRRRSESWRVREVTLL